MTGEQIPIANPPPLPSHLPDHVLDLAVRATRKQPPDDDRRSLEGFRRAANYIAAGKTASKLTYTPLPPLTPPGPPHPSSLLLPSRDT